jgi:chromate reductase
MKLLIFAASHRKQSVNRTLAAIAASFAREEGAEVDFPEYGNFDMPIYDDETFNRRALPASAKRFVAHLKKCDGMIVSSPEYNWSFPGSLKNIIDWASVIKPNPFVGKTALLLSASPSLRGGAQGLVHLKVPLQALGVFVFPRLFTLARAEDAFDGAKAFKNRSLHTEMQGLVHHFMQTTAALAGGGRLRGKAK